MRRAWLAGLFVVGALASGCGDDGQSSDAGDADSAGTTVGDGGDGGDGGDSGAGAPTVLPKFCDLLTAERVTAAVGATVTLTTGPFDACEFKQEDPRAISGSLGTAEVDTGNGGYDAYRSGSAAALADPVEHTFDGIGDQAYVTVGTFGGGESLQAAGGALVGGVVYTLNLAQASGMTEDQLVAVGQALLQLMVDAA